MDLYYLYKWTLFSKFLGKLPDINMSPVYSPRQFLDSSVWNRIPSSAALEVRDPKQDNPYHGRHYRNTWKQNVYIIDESH